ncbi:hypothetical protein GIS00_14770 [Nakamurella sp. YIM 132087]|uniref:Uncharacterized protein n=1 Tax=Nakamurella alba TaxID=2665158 RepID=A0A7K1FQY1_9ACTN|nr:hypothetical protein [Nakamurella alba]MTD15204.1 hypothetical protein [Nakamurella alba]
MAQDLPDIAEIRQTLDLIQQQNTTQTPVDRLDREHAVLLSLQNQVLSVVTREDLPADYTSPDDLRALLDAIENTVQQNRTARMPSGDAGPDGL